MYQDIPKPACAAIATPVRGIESASQDLTRANAYLATLIKELEERLAPTLRAESPANDSEKAPAYSSQLAQSIQREAIFVSEQGHRIASLINRLEV